RTRCRIARHLFRSSRILGSSSMTARRRSWCCSTRIARSCFHAASVVSMGRAKKLLPGSTNEPRFSPVSRRRTTYFQYAAWSAYSQILCAPGAGRHAAIAGETPRREPARLGPCHDFLSNASSRRSSSRAISGSGGRMLSILFCNTRDRDIIYTASDSISRGRTMHTIHARRASCILALLGTALLITPVLAQRRGGGGAPAQEPLQFRFMGPAVGNRISSAVGIPGDPTTYYVGAASGGVWKSTDSGQRWAPVFDGQPAQAIGALALAVSDPK